MEWDETLERLKGVGPKKAAALRRLGLATVYDLLTYYPRAYIDQSRATRLADLRAGDEATVTGRLLNLNERRSGRGMTILTAMIGDGTGYLLLTWFNQPFLKKKADSRAADFGDRTDRLRLRRAGRPDDESNAGF